MVLPTMEDRTIPNWCMNRLTLTANTPEAEVILNNIVAANGQGLFNILRPMPPNIFRGNLGQAEREKYGTANWYDWGIANWGCKWDADADTWDHADNVLTLGFDSAWGPPIELYSYLAERGFGVDAGYYEPGMDFAGTWVDGEDRIESGISDAARRDESEWTTFQADLIEEWGIVEMVAQMEEDI